MEVERYKIEDGFLHFDIAFTGYAGRSNTNISDGPRFACTLDLGKYSSFVFDARDDCVRIQVSFFDGPILAFQNSLLRDGKLLKELRAGVLAAKMRCQNEGCDT